MAERRPVIATALVPVTVILAATLLAGCAGAASSVSPGLPGSLTSPSPPGAPGSMLPTPAATPLVTPSPAVTPSHAVTGGLATDETPFTATQAPDAPSPGVSGTPEPALTMPVEHPLETRLPRQLRASPVRVDVTAGPDIDPDTDPDMLRFIAAAGAVPGDVTMAVGRSEDGSWDGFVAAIQVRGADPGRLLQSFLDTLRTAGGAALEETAESIAGRSVTRVINRDSPEEGPLYMLAIGDTLFLVQSVDAAVAEEAIGAFK